EAAGDHRRGGVGEEVEGEEGEREEGGVDSQRRQRDRSQPGHEGGVDEREQRVGGERAEGRDRQRQDAPVDGAQACLSGHGQYRRSSHDPHLGLRAVHTSRPNWMNRIEIPAHSSVGNSAFRSCSILSGSVLWVSSSRPATRFTWVSTAIAGLFHASASSTEAVLRPTPGSFTSSSIVSGTTPSYISSTAAARAMIDFVFCR